MTVCALWSTLQYPANTFTISVDRLTATCAQNGPSGTRYNAFCVPNVTSGKYFFSANLSGIGGSTQYLFGVADATTSLSNVSTATFPPDCFVVASNDTVYAVVSNTPTAVTTLSANIGIFDFAIDMGAKLAWIRLNGVNWNGSGTANPATGVGGASISSIATLAILMQLNGYASGGQDLVAVLNTGATTYTYAAPSGFSNLPNTLDMALLPSELSNFVAQSVTAPFVWTDGSLAGLKYSLDGGAFTACTGTTTGTTGTALGPVLTDAQPHTISFQSTGNPQDQTGTYQVCGVAVPTGSSITLRHSVLVDGGGGGIPPRPSDLFTYTPVPTLNFQIQGNPAILSGDTFGIQNFASVCIDNAGATPILQAAFSAGNGSTSCTMTLLGGVALAAPSSGPTSIVLTSTSLDWKFPLVCNIALTTLSGGHVFGNISVVSNSGTSTWTAADCGPATSLSTIQSYYTYAPIGAIRSGFAVAPVPAEAVTLNGPITGGIGTPLPLSGTITNGPATSIDYSVTASGSWVLATGFSETGTLFSAQGPSFSMLDTGTITVRDHATLTTSNTVSFSVLGQTYVSQVVEQVWCSIPASTRVGLFQSDVVPTSTTGYVEFGNQLRWNYQTVMLPDNQQMANNAVIRSALAMAFVGNTPVVAVSASDNGGNVLQAVVITPLGGTSVWDGVGAQSTWDVTPWDGGLLPISPWWLAWSGPIVFKQAQFMASGQSASGFRIGNLYAEYRVLGYMQQNLSGVN